MVDHIYPPRVSGELGAQQLLAPLNNYSSFSYWQEPLPSFDIEDEIRKMTGEAGSNNATGGGSQDNKDGGSSDTNSAKK